MKYLLPLLFLASQSLYSQGQYPISTQKILLGLRSGATAAEIAALLEAEECFLPHDAGAYLKGGAMYLAWFDPASPKAPRSASEVYDILGRFRQQAALSFAQPFLQDPLGAERGLTASLRLRLQPGQSHTRAEELAALVGATSIQADAYMAAWWHLQLPRDAQRSPIEACQVLAAQQGVDLAEPDYLFPIAATTNDFYFYQQWALENTGSPIQGNGTPGADMSMAEAWAITTGDPAIRIGIIDSGVDTAHPDLKDNLLPGFDATGGGSQGYPNLSFPSDAHGTNCAGIAAAKGDNSIGIAGVCYDCSILPIKLFTYVSNPFGAPLPFATGADMAGAINWAWQVGGADLVSNSWGLTDFLLPALPNGTGIVEDALDLALDSARNGKGIPLFFSSGNDGDPPIWPGRRAGLFSVNASTMCDERKFPGSCDGLNWEGNWGDSLDIAAPGVKIAATDLSGSDGYTSGDYNFDFGGTSAACPNAAGVMGLVMSVYPGISLAEAHAVLEGSADKVGGYTYQPGYPSGTWSPELGYGRVNAFAALQAASLVAKADPAPSGLALRVFPNPAADHVFLSLEMPKAGDLQVSLHGLQGQVSMQLFDMQVSRGPYSHLFDLKQLGLPDGVYILNVKNEQGLQGNKLLIVRN